MEDGHRITTEILQEAVACELGLPSAADVKILSFEVAEGSKKGENSACILKALQVVAEAAGEERRLSYMAKCMPLNEFRAKLLKECKIFDAEVTMYTKIIPALRALEERISTPAVFYASSDSFVVVMEDLKQKEYFLADKVRGLDMTQIRLVLEQLALWHATSYHYIETYPDGGLRKFREDFPGLCADKWFNTETADKKTQFEEMMGMMEEIFIAIIEEHCLRDNPQLVRKLKEFSAKREATLNDLHLPKGDFNCILHNDVWCNNFMFRMDENGRPNGVKFLDLQMSRRARPAVDLAYFFGSSTTPDFREKYLEDLLRQYHSALASSLQGFGHGPSVHPFEQFRKDYAECSSFGFCMSQIHAMMRHTPADNKEAFMDFDDMSVEVDAEQMMRKYREGQLKQARESEAVRNSLIALVLEAEQMGVI